LFFGTNKWRQIYDKNNGQAHKCIRLFLDLYKDNLCSLGYSGNNQVREILIKSKNGQKLYYLLFASKHPLGNQFWSHATEKPMDGQLRFIGI
jgi:three-Cys-motif partner protein